MSDTSTAASTNDIVMEYELAAAPETVWRALTESDLIARWLMKNDFVPVVGHRFWLQAKPIEDWDGKVQCEVLEADRPHRLSYSWRGGAGAFAIDTVVTWTIAARDGGGTRLRLEHTGFAPENRMAFEGLNNGWRGHVGPRLVELAESLEQESSPSA